MQTYVSLYQTLISAGNMASATLTSLPVTLDNVKGYSIQSVYTGSPVGTLTILGSNTVDGTYTTIGSEIAIAAAGNSMFVDSIAYYRYLKILYTKTSGTGSITAVLCGKAL